MLTPEMSELITNHNAGMMGTVNDDGTPRVSPKATFFIVNETTIAFANLRSPGTIANIRKRPAIQVSFLDVLLRKSVRVTGDASFIKKGTDAELARQFANSWPDLVSAAAGFVKINITATEMIYSPAYDQGASAEALRETNLAKLNAL
jgi:predicted pyridoxine 5'-phosphate oxidase superfamily flavin-nucleotide-binding protein